MMDNLSTTLEQITQRMSRHHLLASIVSSLRSVVEKARQSDAHTPGTMPLAAPAQPLDNGGYEYYPPLLDPSEPSFITNFDFFGPHLGDFDSTFMDMSHG